MGIDQVLLISSNAVGTRVAQHGHLIDAAKRAGGSLLAYTSGLHAGRSPLGVAVDHRGTAALRHKSGLPYIVLRNGRSHAIPAALAHRTLTGGADTVPIWRRK